MMGMTAEELNAEITSNSSGWQELDSDSCASEYSSTFRTSRGGLVVFLSDDNSTNLESWKCQAVQKYGQIRATGLNSNGKEYPCELDSKDIMNETTRDFYTVGLVPGISGGNATEIESCYSRTLTASCELSCSFPIGLTVLICIGLKLVCMIITALERRQEVILTVGDAIASFLERPDPYTLNNCLMARSNKGQAKTGVIGYRNDYPWVSVFSKSVPFLHGRSPPPQPKRVYTTPKRWRFALPHRLRRFFVLFNLFIILLVLIDCILLPKYLDKVAVDASGISSEDQKINSIYQSKVSLLNAVFIVVVLLVNVPQVVISAIYSVYNNTLTRLLLSAEFNRYSVERRYLRVSHPTGNQRGTYWLSIPYRYTIPFLTLFTLAHWLSSQAVSLVQIIPRTVYGEPDHSRVMLGIAISTLGVKIMVIPVLVALLAIIGLVMRKYDSPAMPVAMNCSAAISAACHPPPGDTDAAKKPVMWGEVDLDVPNLFTTLGPGLEDIQTECRHCSFTSQEVREPDPRIAYY